MVARRVEKRELGPRKFCGTSGRGRTSSQKSRGALRSRRHRPWPGAGAIGSPHSLGPSMPREVATIEKAPPQVFHRLVTSCGVHADNPQRVVARRKAPRVRPSVPSSRKGWRSSPRAGGACVARRQARGDLGPFDPRRLSGRRGHGLCDRRCPSSSGSGRSSPHKGEVLAAPQGVRRPLGLREIDLPRAARRGRQPAKRHAG